MPSSSESSKQSICVERRGCVLCVESGDGEPLGVFMICNGQDPDVDVTSTRHQENGEELPGKVECQYGRRLLL